MPSKRSNTKKTQVNEEVDFVLKHRIAGAAFLLFFGALFLPWVLGAPSKDEVNAEHENHPYSEEVETARDESLIEDEESLLAEIESIQAPLSEQVYISKITPLDQNQVTDRVGAANANSVPQATSNDSEDLPEPKDQTEAFEQAENSVNNPEVQPELDDRELALLKQLDEEASRLSAQNETASNDGEGSTTSNTIEVGWVVQVGVFTDKKGVERVVADLRQKGFTPSTTTVDTNRGKATGTRIWLGPYEQRVEAARSKSRLTEKTGEAGFIREYPW